jgi:hypothetical protein
METAHYRLGGRPSVINGDGANAEIVRELDMNRAKYRIRSGSVCLHEKLTNRAGF